MSTDPEPLEVWCAGSEWCPKRVVSDHDDRDADRTEVAPVVIHRLLENGSLGFNALKQEVDGISGKVQSDVLEDLEEHGFVERTFLSEKPFRVEYSLTDRGRSLEPVIVAMRDWGNEHLTAPDDQ